VLVTGIAWAHLPRELGCSGTTVWRRLHDWQAAAAWQRLHKTLLDKLNAAGAIDWPASVVDGSHIRALQGALTGPSPVDRGRTGSKQRTLAWLHQFRRLRLRWERRPELHRAFMHLACAFICQRFLRAL
jgi:transposase